MNEDRPAEFVPSSRLAIPSSATPKPKKTLSTTPSAASSLTGERRWMTESAPIPSSPVTEAPASSRGRLRGSQPTCTARMKAAHTPGSVAWAMASLTSARRRRTRKVPIGPQAAPRSVVPASTTRVL